MRALVRRGQSDSMFAQRPVSCMFHFTQHLPVTRSTSGPMSNATRKPIRRFRCSYAISPSTRKWQCKSVRVRVCGCRACAFLFRLRLNVTVTFGVCARRTILASLATGCVLITAVKRSDGFLGNFNLRDRHREAFMPSDNEARSPFLTLHKLLMVLFGVGAHILVDARS